MKVVEFQLQIQSWPKYTTDVLWTVDKQAPSPQPLEGGDGKGVLVLCIMDAEKVDALHDFCKEHSDIRIYSDFRTYDLDDSLYRPENSVFWQVGRKAVVKARSFSKGE
jgi:hypothetical protein